MMSAESNSEKSVSHQKKDGHGHARPSFFGYDNDKGLFPLDKRHNVMCDEHRSLHGCVHSQSMANLQLS